MAKDFIEKEKQFSGRYAPTVFKSLFMAYRPFLARMIFLLAIGWIGRIALLANTNIIGFWVDSYCKGPDCRVLPSFLEGFGNADYVRLLFILTLSGFVIALIFRTGFSRLSAQAVSLFYDEVTYRTSRFPMSFFDTTPAGRIITRFSSDYGHIFRMFGGPFAELIGIVFDLVAMVFLLVWASPYYLVLCALIFLINWGVYRTNIRAIRQARRELSLNRSPSIAHFAETVQGASTIRAFQKQSSFAKRFEILNGLFLEQRLKTNSVIYRFSLQMNLLTAFMLLITGVVGIFLIQSGTLSVGAVGVALTFITLSTTTLNLLFEWLSQMEEAMTGVERLDGYLRLPIEPSSALPSYANFETAHARHTPQAEAVIAKRPASELRQASLRFDDVWFRYRSDLPFVLKGISFEIQPGERLGVIGRTGSGKSSLIQALFQLYPIDSGKILINGQALGGEFFPNLQLYRQAIALIPQDPVLFEGTLQENLVSSGETFSSEALRSVLTRVGLDLPLTHPIQERGRNLSLGERQLICMARCLLQDTPIVVMDEATSSVDPRSEEIMEEATHSIFAGRTQIIIAHRLSTLADCDRILWVDSGKQHMIGTPSEVLSSFQKASLTV